MTVPPTAVMMYIIVEIMAALLSFLALATKEMRRGRIGKSAHRPTEDSRLLAHLGSAKCVKKLMGNNDVEEALQKLDRLTQEEARMAAAELIKITYAADDRVGVDEGVQSAGNNFEVVGNEVRGINHKVRDIHNGVQGANRSSSPCPYFSYRFEGSGIVHREPAPR